MKAKRISVSIPPEIERAARAISAKNGCSVAAVLADFIAAGQQKIDLGAHFDELKSNLKTAPSGANFNAETIEKISAVLAEIRAVVCERADASGPKNCIALQREAAEKLFEASFFSSAVIAELSAGDMPGAVRQPLIHYVRSAREKTREQMRLFLSLI